MGSVRTQRRIVTEAAWRPSGLSALFAPFLEKGDHVYTLTPFKPGVLICLLLQLCQQHTQ